MLADDTFVECVTDAYKNLYNLVALRTHELVHHLVEGELSAKERGWQLHHILLEALEEMDPGPQTPTFSREWRRHRLVWMRYVEALDSQTVADKLSISRRQYYREHRMAVEAIANILWSRSKQLARQELEEKPAHVTGAEPTGLLQQETSRFVSQTEYAEFDEVLTRCLALLENVVQQQHLLVDRQRVQEVPQVAANPSILRQVLVGMLGYLIEAATQATLTLAVEVQEQHVVFSAAVDPADRLPVPSHDARRRYASLNEMALLYKGQVQLLYSENAIIGLTATMPVAEERTILVIDDNEDVLALFKRLLRPHRYRVFTASNAAEGYEQAHQLRPDVVTLDLMMPGQDGWDLLQAMQSSVETQDIPIIICSVVKQEELSLFMGATSFVEKPITEEKLLIALAALPEH